MKYIGLSFLFGLVGGTSVLLPEFRVDLLYPGGNLGVVIYAAVVTYAVLYHKIFDIEKVIQITRRDKLAAMGTIAASINHEIRNPLYVIQGLAGSFLANRKEGVYQSEDKIVVKAEEIFKKIEQHATRAMGIMKSFAMFTKQNAPEKFTRTSVCLKETLENVLSLVRSELEFEKIKLNLDFPDSSMQILADERHIEEVLFNLIVNAGQALKSSEGEKLIDISAKYEKGRGVVTITDNGPGISAGKIKRIFEPFYTTKEEGTGLGLYITRQLVEKNRGKIFVSSTPAKGTSFLLEFPV